MGPFDILTEQHRELEDQLEAFESDEGPREAQTQRERFEALAELLRLHTWLEERYLSPLLTRVEGRGRACQEREEHLTMSELMEELEEFEPEADEWWARLTALEDLIVAHARQEELETFPRLDATLEPEEQDSLRRALLGLREQLLSRPSSLSGNGPSFEENSGNA
ncbi:hemerythrin domain-containing protein [Hyalangium versicolor]|uniref:hemerythrin domain-containing protein n=1 Tax=Hyalangium versicolor TaxID=2861190 RepID=UPI001CCF2762|nr:hemerythrin domain-containing protein [Hyalangium versicolor]